MARGINRVTLIGHLGKDPETRYMANGNAVVNFSVATTEGWKDRQTNERQEKTEWHKVVAFNKLAEICSEYLRKGSQVYIEGKLQTRKWQDNNGNDRYSTEIVANVLQMLGGRPNGQRSTAQQQSAPANTSGDQPALPDTDFDDDIPF